MQGGKPDPMRRLDRFALAALLLAVLPAAVAAQTAGERSGGVGVVTTLAGNATVARATLSSPQPLRFKDDVFLRDRITTAEKSIVRVLLGGKALVTVRELSALTITEETGRSTIDLTLGKIAMGVLRQRMRPGEVIEIRTPNAIAAVRGTVLVVELLPAPGGSAGAPRYTTKVSVLHGLVEVSDPSNPSAPPAQVGTLESWSRTGSEPVSFTQLTPAGAEQIFGDLRSAPQIAEGPSDFMSSVTTREQAKAVAVAEFLAPEMTGAGGGGDSGSASSTPSSRPSDTVGITDAPVIPLVSSAGPGPGGSGGNSGPARFSFDGQIVTQPGSLYSLAGGRTDTPTVPILEATNSSLTFGQSLMDVSGGGTFGSTTTAPLLSLDPSTLTTSSVLTLSGGARFSLMGSLLQGQGAVLAFGSNLLDLSVGANLSGTGTSALVDLNGSSVSTASSLLSVSGGAVLDLLLASAPLLNLTNGAALVTQRNLVDLSGGAVVKLSQLTSLTASSLAIKGSALNLAGGASLTVAGDLFRIAGGSTLSLTDGALIRLSGGSSLNVGGALINFIGTGNTLSISNNLCGNGCTMLGNLPVLVQGGGSITLSNPILNLTGNHLNIAPGSAVITVTGGSQVKQGP
jgi:hypothetical protein